MRAASSIPASASHDACDPGTRVKTGVTMPSCMGSVLVPLLAGEQCAVGDDVLLDLGRAGPDRRVALEAVETRPVAAVDGVGTPLGQQPVRTEHVDRELGQGLREMAPLQLRERHLGPVLLALDDLRECAVVEQLGELD